MSFELTQLPEAHDVFVECYRERADSEEMNARLRGWDVFCMVLDGKIIGAISGRDKYFHMGVLPQYRGKWASRRRLRQIGEWATTRGYTLVKVRFGSVGAKMATIGGMVLKQRIAGGCEYAYAP
jgi:GNAT superfamily N-acetyltransferase